MLSRTYGFANYSSGAESSYTALDKSGQVDKLAEQHDLADVQAVAEDEIRAAVEEISRSTAAITKQTETLRLQQDALSRLVKKGGENESRRRDFELSRQQNSSTERKFVSAEVSNTPSFGCMSYKDSTDDVETVYDRLRTCHKA